jgi:hypothetical protein
LSVQPPEKLFKPFFRVRSANSILHRMLRSSVKGGCEHVETGVAGWGEGKVVA